ncbi:MAG: DNA-directed RNA polymerase subunit L [Candidatus Diapherotrites archaeon]
MELEILQNEKETLEFKLKGERHTFPLLLKYYLLKDPEVEFASYKLNHPHDKDSLFLLKTKGKNPKKALLEANKRIAEEAAEFTKCLKALGK